MSIVVMNTLTRSKEVLETRDPGKVAIYVCGPTVYNHIHVGNARSAIVFDVIRRYLRWRGYDVTFVQNYTDVDDKIITKAQEEGRDPTDVAREYSLAFEDVMNALGVQAPDILVKATDHIDSMIDEIQRLIANEHAYESNGSVWFSVESFAGYGKLSGRSLDDVRAGERVEPDPSKRNPLDFAVWKAAKPGEPSWESPWGQGRPGWHIECSAMSVKYIGMGFDIHGGGSDLIFPHHENEIAQAEGAAGAAPFVRYWLHNGMVNVDATKMSKSLGNFVLAKDFITEVSPSTLRFMAIAGHYRSDVDFGDDAERQARRATERFEVFWQAAGTSAGDVTDAGSRFLERFTAAMDDDFNTPLAISVLHDLVRNGNAELELISRGDEEAAVRLSSLAGAFSQITEVLGIKPVARKAGDGLVADLIGLALEMREEARKARRFEDADSIRDRLGELGVVIEDTPAGARWHLKM